MNEFYVGFYVVVAMLVSVADNRRGTVGCHSHRYGGGLKLIGFVLESDKMHRVPRTHFISDDGHGRVL